MKLLITGSRDATPGMIEYTKKVVDRANKLGWFIIVGDAPGIDWMVIVHCDLLGVPVEVHGAYNKMRNSTSTGKNSTHDCSYPLRDLIMADLCDRCMAIWNGKSKGTMITYKAVTALGKPVDLKTFKE